MADPTALGALLVGERAGVDAAALSLTLRQAIDDARRAWPDISLPDEPFVAHLGARLRPDEDIAAALASLKITDLYLACAAARGDAAAVAAFEQTLLARVGHFIGRVDG